MPATPRRRLEPEARRLEILDAAECLLRVHGAAVRVEDVMREAGAAKGTFYVYFPTWDDLLEAARERQLAAFAAAYPLPSAVYGPVDWPAVLRQQAEAMVDFIVALGGLHDVLFHGDFVQRRPIPAGRDPTSRLRAVIRTGQQDGAFEDVDPRPVARLLFAVVHETADAVSAGEDREHQLAAMRRMIRGAISGAA